MKRSLSLVLVLTLLLSLSLGAIQPALGETKTEDPIVLRAAIVDYSVVGFFEETMKEFTKLHPNVTFEPIDILNKEYIEKVTVMLAGGDDVDLIYSKNMPQYLTMITNGQVADISSLVARDNVDLSIYNGATDKLTVDGKLYGLPFRSDLWLLFYNKDLFDKQGVPYPTDNMTWEEYAEMCQKMSSGEGAERVYGGYLQNWPASVQNISIQNGKNTTVSTDYAFMRPAYEMALSLQKNKYIMDYASITAGSLHYSGVFFNQQAATVYQGTWFVGLLLKEAKAGNLKFNWGVVKAPHTSDGQEGDAVGALFPMCINSKSKNQEMAWEYLKFLTSKEGAAIIAKYGYLPAARDQSVIDAFVSQEGFPAGCETAFDIKQLSLEVPAHPKAGAIGTVLNEENSLIMTESISLDQGVEDLNSRVNEILNEN